MGPGPDPDGEEGGRVGGFLEGFLEEPVDLAMPWLLGGIERKPRRWLVFPPEHPRGQEGPAWDPYVTQHQQSSQKATGPPLPGGALAGLLEVVAPCSGRPMFCSTFWHRALSTGAHDAWGAF